MSIPKTRIATCMCGALKVSTRGEPVRVSICHCLECKVRCGSAFSFQARWKDEDIKIEGEYNTHVVLADSKASSDARFNFCPHCGSNVFYTNLNMPDITAVAVGAFADPQFPPPAYSVFEGRKHSWLEITGPNIEHFE